MVKLIPTTVLGLIAVYIAWAQWWTAANKVRLDLFDKRMQVYTELRSIVSDISIKGAVEPQDLISFARAADRANFLFRSDVLQFLARTEANLHRLRSAETKMAGTTGGQQEAAAEQADSIYPELAAFFGQLTEHFRPYLDASRLWRGRWFWTWSDDRPSRPRVHALSGHGGRS